jgi:FkbM family methyltransferase
MNFIEIGSNDYDTILHSDFFSASSWGIIVEPLSEFFNNLPKYQNVQYLNCAVTADYDGTIDFFAPISNPSPEWVKSVGSIHADHPTLKELDIKNQIRKTQVKAISLSTLYNHIPKSPIHFLKVDTEGNDFSLLNNWRFDLFRPLHIQFESKLMKSTVLNQLLDTLKTNGYSIAAGQHQDYKQRPYNHIAVLEI